MGRFDSHWEKAYKKLAEDYFDLGDKYDQLNEDVDKWQALEDRVKFETSVRDMLDTQPKQFLYKGIAYSRDIIPSRQGFTVDTKGIVEPVGQYKIVVTKIEDTKENTNGS